MHLISRKRISGIGNYDLIREYHSSRLVTKLPLATYYYAGLIRVECFRCDLVFRALWCSYQAFSTAPNEKLLDFKPESFVVFAKATSTVWSSLVDQSPSSS